MHDVEVRAVFREIALRAEVGLLDAKLDGNVTFEVFRDIRISATKALQELEAEPAGDQEVGSV